MKPVAQRGRFTIALSGGSTPKSLYNLLATNARTALPWDRMFFFWGDERHVPPTDPDSNYPHGGRSDAVEDSCARRECVPDSSRESRRGGRCASLRTDSPEILSSWNQDSFQPST